MCAFRCTWHQATEDNCQGTKYSSSDNLTLHALSFHTIVLTTQHKSLQHLHRTPAHTLGTQPLTVCDVLSSEDLFTDVHKDQFPLRNMAPKDKKVKRYGQPRATKDDFDKMLSNRKATNTGMTQIMDFTEQELMDFNTVMQDHLRADTPGANVPAGGLYGYEEVSPVKLWMHNTGRHTQLKPLLGNVYEQVRQQYPSHFPRFQLSGTTTEGTETWYKPSSSEMDSVLEVAVKQRINEMQAQPTQREAATSGDCKRRAKDFRP